MIDTQGSAESMIGLLQKILELEKLNKLQFMATSNLTLVANRREQIPELVNKMIDKFQQMIQSS